MSASNWTKLKATLPPVMAFATMLAATGAARADSIDGDWCSEKGRRISIDGPAYSLSGAAKAQGDYTRHAFAFRMPTGEPDAGAVVDMVLQGETRVRVRIGESEPQIWRRCPPGIS